METITLNDGTELSPAHAFVASGILWVYLDNGISLSDAFELLNDPSKTEVIKVGTDIVFEGYTDLFCIRREENGQVNAGLRKA